MDRMSENFILNATLVVTFKSTSTITSAQLQSAISVIPGDCTITGIEPASVTNVVDSAESFVVLRVRFRSNGSISANRLYEAMRNQSGDIMGDAVIEVTVDDRTDYKFAQALQDVIDKSGATSPQDEPEEPEESEAPEDFEQEFDNLDIGFVLAALTSYGITGDEKVTCAGNPHFQIVYNSTDDVLDIEPIDD